MCATRKTSLAKYLEKMKRTKRKTPLESSHNSLAKLGNDFHPTPQAGEHDV
jgi:hypothetical protein